MGIGSKLQSLLDERGIKPGTLATATGISRNTLYSIIKRDNENVNLSVLERISKELDVPMEYFFDAPSDRHIPSNARPMPKTYKLPHRGKIACGQPLLAIEEVGEYSDVPEEIRADFTLTCTGDSMIGIHIVEGDIACIRSQRDVENGQIAAVEVDGEATLKRVRKIVNNSGRIVAIELIAENASFPILRYEGAEMDDISIDGLLTGVIRTMRQ